MYNQLDITSCSQSRHVILRCYVLGVCCQQSGLVWTSWLSLVRLVHVVSKCIHNYAAYVNKGLHCGHLWWLGGHHSSDYDVLYIHQKFIIVPALVMCTCQILVCILSLLLLCNLIGTTIGDSHYACYHSGCSQILPVRHWCNVHISYQGYTENAIFEGVTQRFIDTVYQ